MNFWQIFLIVYVICAFILFIPVLIERISDYRDRQKIERMIEMFKEEDNENE